MDLLGVFTEGLLSFLSPCVLPLIPLYISYLAGDNKQVDENGNVSYDRLKVFIMTIFFTLGIAMTFVLLSLSINSLGSYLEKYSEIISIIGGTLIIIFALHQIGIIHIDILERQFTIKNNLLSGKMNYLKAFLLGFVFSLGWSPCIGPMLASAILLASSTGNYLYILVYGLGLIIPFLITGLFTSTILNFLSKNSHILKYTTIIAGIIMLGFGGYMIYDAGNKIIATKNISQMINNNNNAVSTPDEGGDIQTYLINYEFKNAEGDVVKLADYKGKYVILNFTTTWCTYCMAEIPIYEEFSHNEDVKCFYVMSDLQEYSSDAISSFIKENDIKVEVIKDDEDILFYYCQGSAFPTTFVISPESEFLVYYSGAMDLQSFNNLLDYAKEADQE